MEEQPLANQRVLVRVGAVLFDFGGTLLHYKREEVLRALLKERGFDVSPSEILAAYAVIDPVWSELTAELPQHTWWPDDMLEQFDHLVLEHLGIEKEHGEIAHFVRENWDRVDHQLPKTYIRTLYPDVLPCLEGLRNLGTKMGIVSNIPSEERLSRELGSLGLGRYFPVQVASGSVGAAKPDKRIFDTAAKRIDKPPHEILFVGDDLQRDYEGAMQAGMKALLIDRREIHKSHTDACRISSLEEILSVLD